MSNGFSWFDRPGSLSVNNKQILSIKINELTKNTAEIKEKIELFLQQLIEWENLFEELTSLRQNHTLTARHVLEINLLQQKILSINKCLKESGLIHYFDKDSTVFSPEHP